MKKRLLSLVLTGVLCFGMSVSVFAETTEENVESTEEAVEATEESEPAEMLFLPYMGSDNWQDYFSSEQQWKTYSKIAEAGGYYDTLICNEAWTIEGLDSKLKELNFNNLMDKIDMTKICLGHPDISMNNEKGFDLAERYAMHFKNPGEVKKTVEITSNIYQGIPPQKDYWKDEHSWEYEMILFAIKEDGTLSTIDDAELIKHWESGEDYYNGEYDGWYQFKATVETTDMLIPFFYIVEPEQKPEEPSTEPEEPSTEPSEPEQKPEEPSTEPSEPEQKPESKPESKPTPGSKETTYTAENGTTMRRIESKGNTVTALDAAEGYVPAGASFSSDALTEGDTYNRAAEAVSKNLSGVTKFAVYEMNLTDASNVAIHELGGFVNVTLSVPAGFDSGKTLTVYRVEDNGTLTKCTTATANGYLTFATNHFSTYIIAEGNTVASTETSPKTADNTNGIALAVAAFAALVGTACVVKKRSLYL